MKIFKYKCLATILITMFHLSLQSHSVITFFVTQETNAEDTPRKKSKFISEKLQQPSFVNAAGNDQSWLEQPGINGLQASYAGYMAISDKNGQISFPRLHQKEDIFLLVTPEIDPEYMIYPSLVHHWITKHNSPAAFYKISRKKNAELNTYYFQVTELNLPRDLHPSTIILYEHPENIRVPLGISLNNYSTNFILPELKAKKPAAIKNSLYTFSIKQYFEPIDIATQNNTQTIASMLLNQ